METTKLSGRFHHETNFKARFNIQLSVINFFNFEDCIHNALQGCVVNKFSCGQCTSKFIGETSGHCTTRIAEHIGISFRTGQSLSIAPYSNIRDCGIQEGHF